MEGVHDFPAFTRSDAIAEVLSAGSCHLVLDTSPPDYVQKITRYLETSVGQNRLDELHTEPTQAESDSGDSLFITQKPVPEAGRSTRRLRYSSWSKPISPSDLEESEDDIVLSASHGKPKTAKKRGEKKYRLPKYSFPFLSGKKWKPRSTLLSVKESISLNNATIGGFFKCVTELWQDCQKGHHLESSLPTVDMEGEYISPLSEEEEGRSEDEDIRVVRKKCFVAPSKAKSQQILCSQLKPQSRKKAGTAGQETSQGRQWNTLHKLPAKASTLKVTALSLDTENSVDVESSCRVLLERERSDEHVTSNEPFLVQTETPKKYRYLSRRNKKILFQQKAQKEELCYSSDATVCEPHGLQRSPRQCTQKDREASTTLTDDQIDVFCTENLSQTGQAEDEPGYQNLLHSLPDFKSDTNNDSVCSETRVKKSKKKKKDKGDCKSVEEKGQSQKEPTDVGVEETPSLSGDNKAEPPASQTSDELDINERNCMENFFHDENILRQEGRDIPDSKPKKKKRKKNKSAAENVRQEVDGNVESDVRMENSVFSVSCNMKDGVKKKKKKKRKQSGEEEDNVEQLQSSAVAEPLNDAEVQKKKKKKKERIVIKEECDKEEAPNRTFDLPPLSTEQLEESGDGLENTAASQEASESSQEKKYKRKKHKKKRTSSNEATQDGEEGVDVSFSNGAVTLARSTEMPLKKKKKKKTVSEGVDVSHIPEENEKFQNVDNSQKTIYGIEDKSVVQVTKKKKKKKISEISNMNTTEDHMAQSDDLVSVQKKEKRASSFLVADAEENNAQTHRDQDSPSHSVNARVWGAEKAGISVGDFQTESAEIAGNFEESNEEMRKKKKKRKRKMSVVQDSVEKDDEPDFEKPNRTCRSALPEISDTGVKRKKKRMGNESELVTPMERFEKAAHMGHSPAGEAVVIKKKKKKKKEKKCKDEPCHVIQESPPSKKANN